MSDVQSIYSLLKAYGADLYCCHCQSSIVIYERSSVDLPNTLILQPRYIFVPN